MLTDPELGGFAFGCVGVRLTEEGSEDVIVTEPDGLGIAVMLVAVGGLGEGWGLLAVFVVRFSAQLDVGVGVEAGFGAAGDDGLLEEPKLMTFDVTLTAETVAPLEVSAAAAATFLEAAASRAMISESPTGLLAPPFFWLLAFSIWIILRQKSLASSKDASRPEMDMYISRIMSLS